ncbi:hypothetical protein [Paenibacillus ehimensis]|uniref:Uncharacterized protein n=1 Tax=Paenibacillus ehimensis TaxID=79264 RepID=A0ABT8V7F7_9BACL|nr:hypothetical protein [Paenibacillus ehimensis]MDO3675905.1 hypothetical protein [Paenibacillus ehimensis]MEC0208534.1 hypothetical protein [Paenibacillus ehimensis]
MPDMGTLKEAGFLPAVLIAGGAAYSGILAVVAVFYAVRRLAGKRPQAKNKRKG